MQVGSKSTSQQLYVKLRLSCLRYAQRPLHQRLLVVLLAVAFVSFALTSYHSQSNPLPAPPHFSYQPVTMLPKMMYGLAWKKERTTRLVLQALSAGFRAFDVAGQPKHYNEPGLGEAIAYALKTKLIAKREDVFLQTKFTFFPGQDPNDLPYDASLPVAEQFKQSFPNSLKNLQTSYVDSLVLHGPYTGGELVAEDWAVWREMEAVHAKGLAKVLGVSNVNARQLELLVKGAKVKPTFVQNRCYANQGWDSAVRAICKEKGIIYQGFSLLTANFHLQSGIYFSFLWLLFSFVLVLK